MKQAVMQNPGGLLGSFSDSIDKSLSEYSDKPGESLLKAAIATDNGTRLQQYMDARIDATIANYIDANPRESFVSSALMRDNGLAMERYVTKALAPTVDKFRTIMIMLILASVILVAFSVYMLRRK